MDVKVTVVSISCVVGWFVVYTCNHLLIVTKFDNHCLGFCDSCCNYHCTKHMGWIYNDMLNSSC